MIKYEFKGSILKAVPDNKVISIFHKKEIKRSTELVTQLSIILKIVNLAIKGLTPFKYYIPVHKILIVMEEEKTLLQIHYDKNKKIIESKGL